MRFAGSKAVVIGGAGGIGREIVFALTREGAEVLIGDIDMETARGTAAGAGVVSTVDCQECDIASDESVDRFADTAFERLGRVDLLFNHAGVSVGGMLEQVGSADWEWLLNHNVVGLGRSVRAFVPRMTTQGGGWIVNTSSGLGLFHDNPAAAPYIASKAAILGYSRALATYLRNRRIGVSVFCPDITDTRFLDGGRLVALPPALAAMTLPLDRMQRPDQAATCLMDGLRKDRFLISAVPDTAEKLQAMAAGQLTPGSDATPRIGPMIQRGTMRVPSESLEDVLGLCSAFAAASRSHDGCLTYDAAISIDDANTIVMFEVWRDQSSIDAHAFAPETLPFVAKLLELGASDFAVNPVGPQVA